MFDFALLAHDCAPQVHPNTLAHVIAVESGYNPYAIGIVGYRLKRQPRNLDEAKATANFLANRGYNYSVGLGQINKNNFQSLGLTIETAFDACKNIAAAGTILHGCYLRALSRSPNEQAALRDAFSCYYSGNFTTGHREGYVNRVVNQGKNKQPKASALRARKASASAPATRAHSPKERLTALLF